MNDNDVRLTQHTPGGCEYCPTDGSRCDVCAPKRPWEDVPRDIGYEILQDLPAFLLRPLFEERRRVFGRTPSNEAGGYQQALRHLADAAVSLKAAGLETRCASVLRYMAGLSEAHGRPVIPTKGGE